MNNNSYKIANISIGQSGLDCAYDFDFRDVHFEVQRFGAHFSVPYFQDMIARFRNQVDAFAVSGLPPVVRFQQKSYIHKDYLEIMSTPSSVPFCDGYRVRELLEINELSRVIANGEIDPQKGIFMPLSIYQSDVLNYLLEHHRENLFIGDYYSLFGLNKIINGDSILIKGQSLLLNFLTYRKVINSSPLALNGFKLQNRSKIAKSIEGIGNIIVDIGVLDLFGSSLEFLTDKNVIFSFSHPAIEKRVEKFKPRKIIKLYPEKLRLSPFINYAVLDSVLRLSLDKSAPLTLEEWERLLAKAVDLNPDVKKYILNSKPSTQFKVARKISSIKSRLKSKAPPDFAFIIHPLSRKDIFKIPVASQLAKLTGEAGAEKIEKLLTKVPGFHYCDVLNVTSKKTGQTINGIVYCLPSTPKMLMTQDPQLTYDQIEKISYDAALRGAKILGLGAYTKIVGDAGATISRLSPIPVTTGNSLSSSATLWAVYEVSAKLGLLEPLGKRFQGSAMVIGATGSIGRVSAKLLSLAFKKLYLVAPRMERLKELEVEIRKMPKKTAEDCEIICTTNANDFAWKADVLITATSAFDQKIVDVMLLKPGCVVCDCSRPLDFDIKDAMKRPDLLIIESGEVSLPGHVIVTKNIGLPQNTVYACLGETAILAMEQRFESFSMGRDLDWQKVKTIYKLGLDHGVKLAQVHGHAGVISDREINLTRELALKKRQVSGNDK